ncbi:collagenase-like protease [Clostridium sp. CAG:389]|nr:collagenase-like protease [Clostridium sp. CAG:389]
MIDLLSPVGNFDCLKAAVQNGANSVYFGADLFSARAYASNFDLEELEKAIIYAKTRGVKTNLTLNTLIKDDEFDDAFELAKKAYEFGIDAIIVQDLGLAKQLINHFPDLDIHASTQMTVHNLQGVLKLQELGFKRVVLSRELSLQEIEYICKNSDVEIECFIHGALCISYSGQCLFSSMVGARSGNRGKCAQPCRLPYQLMENDIEIDKGHLLSTRDLCGLDYIPSLINAGVTCLKIEGRMKNPEYVATVTRIYRKYIDLAEKSFFQNDYKVDESDRKILLQAFNRGMSSTGHLSDEPNRNLIFKDKPNNMGLFLGKVQKYNKNKGYITVKLQEPIEIGDTVSLEKESGSYNITELMIKDKNIKDTKIGQTVTIGRMKGNINLGDNIYKISSKKLNSIAHESINGEHRKVPLNCAISIKHNEPLKIRIKYDTNLSKSSSYLDIYSNLDISYSSNVMPEIAQNRPLEKNTVIAQINKTTDSIFEFANINVDLDSDIFLPKFSATLNELRRNVLNLAYDFAVSNVKRNSLDCSPDTIDSNCKVNGNTNSSKTISVLLNILNTDFDYSNLEGFDNVYIPLKYFTIKKYNEILKVLEQKFNVYIYMPTIIKSNYRNLFFNNIEKTISNYDIKGFVISNISNLKLLENVLTCNDFELIANYTFNIFNLYSVNELKNLGINRFTVSPESTKEIIDNLCNSSLCCNYLPSELIVYGKTPLMNMNYCVLGKTNKCYPTCSSKCMSGNSYYLKDRLNMKFRILFDNIQTVSTIYNCKTTSISSDGFDIACSRIDILDESIDEINNIVNVVKSGSRLEGKEFTNGNLNREI